MWVGGEGRKRGDELLGCRRTGGCLLAQMEKSVGRVGLPWLEVAKISWWYDGEVAWILAASSPVLCVMSGCGCGDLFLHIQSFSILSVSETRKKADLCGISISRYKKKTKPSLGFNDKGT
jgi:hypothetical protein